ncbi:MAG: DUF951 domain-containing protein [Saccharofermentans sp.]|nr:DUF951 domain-containing protein [Saccharofermentans sp.]
MPSKFFLFKYEEGDVISTRKKHPCGSNTWNLLRVGADCKLVCTGCERQMIVNRPQLEKMTAAVQRGSEIFK